MKNIFGQKLSNLENNEMAGQNMLDGIIMCQKHHTQDFLEPKNKLPNK